MSVKPRRALLLFLSLPLLLALGGAAGWYWLIAAPRPALSGHYRLPGLLAPVQVRFGPHAVPTIAAGSLTDLAFAQGFVVAGERLWQMDLLRRLAGGRLAELFGARALPADRFFRVMGLDRAARQALAALDPADRGLLEAHAAGVNAWRERTRRRLPLEYRLAGCVPAPWEPLDSLLIGAYLAWTQSFNLREELTFLRLAVRLGPERARELFPVDEGIPAPPVAPELAAVLTREPAAVAAAWPRPDALDAILDWPERLGLPLPGAASNAWLATGGRTADGQALLANDPHLAPSVPGIWYELELSAPDFQVVGVALPGVPLVLIGHNRDLAWGFTSVIADTQDLFVEHVSPDGRWVARPDGQWETIATESQRIPIKGGGFDELTIRRTSHGVIINDVLGPATGTPLDLPDPGQPWLLALRQVDDLPDLAFAGMRRLNQAATLDAARAAALDFRRVAQNAMLAHRDGGIAWQVSGRLPRRGLGNGAFPSPGWVGGYEWQGLQPAERNPALTDPAGGILITANQRTLPPGESWLSQAWMAPYRAQRIAERLELSDVLTPEKMADIQMDHLSLQASHAQAALRPLEMALWAVDPGVWAIASDELMAWNGAMDGGSRAAGLFALLEPALFQAIYGDELGPDLDLLMGMALAAYNPLQETLRSGVSSFWDDITTPRIETPAEIWARAIQAAHAEQLRRSRSPEGDPLASLRTLTFPHAFGELPWIGRWFSVGPVGMGGSSETVNVAKTSPIAPERVLFVPSLRVVQTPGDWTRTRGTLPLGQSGHLGSPWRADQLEDWLAGRNHPWPWNGPAPTETLGVLRLEPAPDA